MNEIEQIMQTNKVMAESISLNAEIKRVIERKKELEQGLKDIKQMLVDDGFSEERLVLISINQLLKD